MDGKKHAEQKYAQVRCYESSIKFYEASEALEAHILLTGSFGIVLLTVAEISSNVMALD